TEPNGARIGYRRRLERIVRLLREELSKRCRSRLGERRAERLERLLIARLQVEDSVHVSLIHRPSHAPLLSNNQSTAGPSCDHTICQSRTAQLRGAARFAASSLEPNVRCSGAETVHPVGQWG